MKPLVYGVGEATMKPHVNGAVTMKSFVNEGVSIMSLVNMGVCFEVSCKLRW